MQYLHLLGIPGLHFMGRVQLTLAVLMFASSPAWLSFMTLGAIQVGLADDPSSTFNPQLGIVLFACVMGMVFAPKISSVAGKEEFKTDYGIQVRSFVWSRTYTP